MLSKRLFFIVSLLVLTPVISGTSTVNAFELGILKKINLPKRVKNLENRMDDAEGRLDDLEGQQSSGSDLMVLDSSPTPKQVGRFIDLASDEDAIVAFKVDGQLISLRIAKDDYFNNHAGFYTSPNCTGTPLFSTTPKIATRSIVSEPGNSLYVEDGGMVNTTVNSLLAGNNQCIPTSQTGDFLTSQIIVDLDTLFTPPFKIVGDVPSLP